MRSAVFEQIKQAILSKQQVLATYHGHRRQMCPHALGWKNGKEQCLFYQFAGGSSRGLARPGSGRNWRCIPLAGVTDVSVCDGAWHTAAGGHSRAQSCVGRVDTEVAY